MNPPFKRYEAKDAAPISPALRQHFRSAVSALSNSMETDVSQANIYNLYVEFVVKASRSGTIFGIILDNRWYHNKVAQKLREFLLRECEILAVIGYPHDLFFEEWAIATTILVARKGIPNTKHQVHMVRTNDPRRADFSRVARALRGIDSYPDGWHVNQVNQTVLKDKSWQEYFSKALVEDFRNHNMPSLEDLFAITRRGSLAKEGGGIAVYEFPFERTNYGPQVTAKPGLRGNFETVKGRVLTSLENTQLRDVVRKLPAELRGYAIQNSDQLAGYKLTVGDVTQDETLEAPEQRTLDVQKTYFSGTRRKWDASLDTSVAQIKSDALGGAYTSLVERIVGLDETVLSRQELWVALREPYAGELIIPRKIRAGHRVHINPFPYNPMGRQVRLSSNFASYSDCQAIDTTSGLTREVAVELIVAFLLSSFGQIQFEMEAYNREGVRSIEMYQLKKIRVFDPRWIRSENRAKILAATNALPYPVPTDRDPQTQAELQVLDKLIAMEIVHRFPTLNEITMLDEVWQTLAEWLQARRP
jgi:hypothetical protein